MCALVQLVTLTLLLSLKLLNLCNWHKVHSQKIQMFMVNYF